MNSAKTALADRICTTEPSEGISLLEMNTPIADVVTITGSLLGGSAFNPPANRTTAQTMVAMLDQGTKSQNKFVISEKLEELGALLTFSETQHQIRFSARCLKDDVSLVVELLADQLRNPLFPEEDLETTKTNMIGDLLRTKEETQFMVTNRFLREVYLETHPNYMLPVDDQVNLIQKLKREDLQAFHEAMLGRGSIRVVAVGDTDTTVLSKALRDGFGGWRKSSLSMADVEYTTAKKMNGTQQTLEAMQEKTSVDIMLGQPIGIDRDHKDYLPLMLGHFVLGGNFSARLMSTVRDQKGLTYGIRSAVGGADKTDGYWYVWGTFSPQLVKKGRVAAMEQIEHWIAGGIEKNELRAKKTTIIGSYQVSFSTTGGIATQILINSERGRSVDYLDRFPEEIAAISLDQVNSTIPKYCQMENILSVAAGSINDNWEPLS
jgi:zinc protease